MPRYGSLHSGLVLYVSAVAERSTEERVVAVRVGALYSSELQVGGSLERYGVQCGYSSVAIHCRFAVEAKAIVGIGVVQACVEEAHTFRRIPLIGLCFVGF